ncbi:hypothetical protein KL930_002177 [Ogataea haglerorum]|uniref:Uncharacterized protein n=1 Tax=Ogataea haglerorum TaxID=1937702 RepID=A0AAN6I1V9_9ASCO|nr:uncharacterized protein KL911_000219 [Ogataea haglerorum]KAG7699036.1 hypothetical protein KL915_001328 [Ogataea haglerorum]KAG7700639.1 hypothetical protein KL951_000754 [Ogataea haglerorum]KAG7710078.1 hypothetical protein KL914_000988 [Ogataea haglerorum]KAG7711141.1 hypothetical protein KL950_001107 [Ogataea haglerorum]KAG7720439.1 hypothetical protein KL913_001339 [Ogataea haglerorum]
MAVSKNKILSHHMNFEETKLYGGAITTYIPAGMVDASTLRQIPDTQEVFVAGPDTQLGPEDAIIFDLLESVDVPDDAAAEYHFQELAKLNGADNAKVLEATKIVCPNFAQDPTYVLVGSQEAKKWGRDQTELVVLLGLIRLQRVQTDLLITYNLPGEDFGPRIPVAKQVIQHILESLQVQDWSLFG